jgi:glyoxylase I family protein
MTLKVRGVDHLVLRARDLAAKERVYVEVIGLAVQLRAGAQLIDLVDAAGMIGGGAAPAEAGRNLDHLCLNLDDFDLAAVIAHLEAHGVAVGESGRRYGAGGFGVSVYLTDPEGNGLELRG